MPRLCDYGGIKGVVIPLEYRYVISSTEQSSSTATTEDLRKNSRQSGHSNKTFRLLTRVYVVVHVRKVGPTY